MQRFGMLNNMLPTTPMSENHVLCAWRGKDIEDKTMRWQMIGILVYLTLTSMGISYIGSWGGPPVSLFILSTLFGCNTTFIRSIN